jgi:hypothetical protein
MLILSSNVQALLWTSGGQSTTNSTVRGHIFACFQLLIGTCLSTGKTMNPDSLLLKLLAGEHQYAKLWLVCLALRGVAWDKMPFDQRELAFEAKDAASNCLAIFLNSSEYRSDAPFRPQQFVPYSDMSFATPIRAALRYAVHDSLVTAAFSGLFLLKMANLFPRELDLASITVQVEQMAQLLSDVAAERCALFSFSFLTTRDE